MSSYVDFEYYTNTFEGSLIPEDSFDKKALEASRKVNYFTSGKIEEVNDDIKDATCSIAELLYNQEILKDKVTNVNSTEKSSETVGPWSVTYANNTQYQSNQILTDKQINSSAYQICKEYLDSKLLFRGVR